VNQQELASSKRPPAKKRFATTASHFRGGGSLPVKNAGEFVGQRRASSVVGGFATHGFKKVFGFQALMHFSSYLMIAAMVLMGLQLAYAFYQLAVLFL